MEKVFVGKIVNTHGIKGELRIISKFPFKEKVFCVGNRLIIDDKQYEIKSYRVHKEFDMVTFDDYNNINEVLFLLKKDVYFDKSKLNLDDNQVLDEELISYKVLTNNGQEGIIKEIFLASENNKVLRILLDREILLPLNSPMVKINKEKREVYIELIEGM